MLFSIAALVVFYSPAGFAQQPEDRYNRQEVMIPMRDGIKLHTVIFTPVEQTAALPFLLERTPYGVSDYSSPEKNGYVKDMADEGYTVNCNFSNLSMRLHWLQSKTGL